MIDVAFAQAAAPAQGAPPWAVLGQLLPFLLVFLIFYFLVIRPQSKRQRETQKMLENLKKGDRVLTSGGIYGDVVDVKKDTAVLKVADTVKMEFTKQSIVGVQPKSED